MLSNLITGSGEVMNNIIITCPEIHLNINKSTNNSQVDPLMPAEQISINQFFNMFKVEAKSLVATICVDTAGVFFFKS